MTTEEYDLEGKGPDETAEIIRDKLLECENCGSKMKEGIDGLEKGTTSSGQMALKAEFDCFCGYHNVNTAVLGP